MSWTRFILCVSRSNVSITLGPALLCDHVTASRQVPHRGACFLAQLQHLYLMWWWENWCDLFLSAPASAFVQHPRCSCWHIYEPPGRLSGKKPFITAAGFYRQIDLLLPVICCKGQLLLDWSLILWAVIPRFINSVENTATTFGSTSPFLDFLNRRKTSK